MLQTMKPDEERLVPYSVELSVFVMDNVESHNENVYRVVIRNGQLKSHYVQVAQTTYHFNNKSDMPQVVYLEHPRATREWKLYDTPEPHEVTENYWRFRFNIEPKTMTPFVVKARQTLYSQFNLTDITDHTLNIWIGQKYLDAKTQKTLKQAIDLRQEAAKIDRLLQDLEKQRLSVHDEQKRIRENLQAIGDRPGEKELRERYLKTLNSQEDRLEKIDKDAKKNIEARDDCREKMNVILAKLEYDAELADL
jgi:hypothetical protein